LDNGGIQVAHVELARVVECMRLRFDLILVHAEGVRIDVQPPASHALVRRRAAAAPSRHN
jgi:hypothetical protein